MMNRLTLTEAAAELRKTPRWLRDWVRAHPRDKSGLPYYTPAGRDKLFHPNDIARIEQALREDVTCLSGSGRRVKAKRRISKSAEPTLDAAWRSAAELTNDPSLLPNCERSNSASSSTDATPRPKLRLIQSNRLS